MTRILSLLFCLLLLASNTLHAQFIIQNSGTQQSLEDVRFYDSQLGIIVGDSGTVLRSIDGGNIWTTVPTGINSKLSRVRFFDSQNALVIGNEPAVILRSADGGQTWTTITDSSNQYYDLVILDDSIALLSTHEALLRTRDLGQTWQVHYDGPATDRLGLMSFIDAQRGFSIRGWAGFSPAFSIQKTTDGGGSWTEIPMLSGQNPTILEALIYLNDSTGFAAGWYNPHLVKTKNAGADWSFSSVEDPQNGGQIIDMTMLNDTLGFASGWYNSIFKTIDGGANWFMLDQPFSTSIQYQGLYFLNDQLGWVVGTQGAILKTNTGGGSVSVSDDLEKISFSVFPNPNFGSFQLQLKSNVKLRSLQLFDIEGRLVERFSFVPEIITLKNSGLYMLVLDTEQGMLTQKVWVH
ncbi:MAG: YCF48-related protein [Bacteroidota bacterium]